MNSTRAAAARTQAVFPLSMNGVSAATRGNSAHAKNCAVAAFRASAALCYGRVSETSQR